MDGTTGRSPHVAQNAYATEIARRRSAIDGRTTRHEGYALSQKKRKRIEEIFGWLKTIGGLRQTKFRGLDRVRMAFAFVLFLAPGPDVGTNDGGLQARKSALEKLVIGSSRVAVDRPQKARGPGRSGVRPAAATAARTAAGNPAARNVVTEQGG
jgi:DDE family transposase